MPFARGDCHRRLFEEEVFTPDRWAYQKSWRRHLPSFTWVHVLRGYLIIVLYLTFLAVLFCLYHTVLVPRGAPDWPPPRTGQYTYQIFAITSFALALLMVFRTNSSYAKWWEARMKWGRIFDMVRSLVRQACLTEAEAQYLSRWQHRILGIAQAMTELVAAAGLPVEERIALDQVIQLAVDTTGGCERLYRTAIPLPYTRHTSRFLLVWLSFLPVALWPVYGWASPAIEFCVAFLLIGVENIEARRLVEQLGMAPATSPERNGTQGGASQFAAAPIPSPAQESAQSGPPGAPLWQRVA